MLRRRLRKDLKSAFFDQAKQKTGNGQNQKYKEQCFGNTDGTGGNAAKAKQGSNQGSGVLSSMVRANGLIVLHHAQGNVTAGDQVSVMMFDGVI